MRLLTALVLILLSFSVAAEKPPKIELGVAFASQYLNDYRGSKESQVQALPVPFLLYRGDKIKIDRKGVRGELLKNKRWELNVSGEASLNGDSEDNSVREGMPELDSAFEIGPSLNINLSGSGFRDGWVLRLPVRAVSALSSGGFDYIGYVFNPRFTYYTDHVNSGWRTSVNVGLVYGSQKYHDYYYSVDAEFVTDGRSFYQAESGFSGSYFKASASRRNGNYWYGASLRYDNLSGSSFEGSPLVETKNYYSLSLIFAYFFWQG